MKKSATKLVEKGFFVLPLMANKKIPCTKGGVYDAQNTKEYVDQAWTDSSKNNIGIACDNILVIDVDVKSGDGVADLKLMEDELGKLDPKGKVVTPSGGLHLYFRNPKCDISGQTHIVFHGQKTQIDIRVNKQYVVAPPSIVNSSSYRWEIEPSSVDELTELPQKWIDFLPKKNGQKQIDQPVIQFDIPSDKVRYVQERCWRYLSKEERPAIQGQGGQHQMFTIMNVIFNGFALSKQDGYPVLMKYNEICQPPWDMNNPTDAHWINKEIDKVIATASSRGSLLNAPRKDDYLPALSSSFLDVSKKPVIIVDDINKFFNKEKPMSGQSLPETKAECYDDEFFISPELLKVPGFISEYIGILRETTPVFNEYTSFSGALALLSLLIGPRFCFEGTYSNIYIVSLAFPGEGKEAPRNLNQHILTCANRDDYFGRNFTSGEAIEDQIIKYGRKLYQVDECDFLFSNIAQGRESYQKSIQASFLELYSRVVGLFKRRDNANNTNNKTFGEKSIWNPFFVFLGTAPPTKYFESLSRRIAEGGLFARLIIINAGDGILFTENKNNYTKHPLCQKLIDFARLLLLFKTDINENTNLVGQTCPIDALEMPIQPEARKMFTDFSEESFYKKRQSGDDEAKRSVYSRAYENAKKFAIIYEISRKMDILINCKDEYKDLDPDQVREVLMIDEEVADWSIRFMHNIIDVQTRMFDRYFYENSHGKLKQDILAFIQKRSRGEQMAVLKTKVFQQFYNNTTTEVESCLLDLKNQDKIEEFDFKDKKGNRKPALRAID